MLFDFVFPTVHHAHWKNRRTKIQEDKWSILFYLLNAESKITTWASTFLLTKYTFYYVIHLGSLLMLQVFIEFL